jgi:hypothetical protein
MPGSAYGGSRTHERALEPSGTLRRSVRLLTVVACSFALVGATLPAALGARPLEPLVSGEGSPFGAFGPSLMRDAVVAGRHAITADALLSRIAVQGGAFYTPARERIKVYVSDSSRQAAPSVTEQPRRPPLPRCRFRAEGVTTIVPAPLHLPTRMQVSIPWTTSVPHLANLGSHEQSDLDECDRVLPRRPAWTGALVWSPKESSGLTAPRS